MAEGFLGRWSQRKTQVRQGAVPAEPAPAPAAPPAPPPAAGAAPAAAAVPAPPPPAAPPPPPAPTLQEAQALQPDADFRRFVAPGVDAPVRNAAVKRLFADPHFNVMDGLDTYIDDYSQPQALPAAALRQMASAQFLRLVDEPPAAPVNPSCEPDDHAHTDLQLQPDPAPGSPGPGTRAGPEPDPA